MDPCELPTVWPAFGREVLERGVPFDDGRPREGQRGAGTLSKGPRDWRDGTCYDETVSGLDPSQAKDNFSRRGVKATRLSNEA